VQKIPISVDTVHCIPNRERWNQYFGKSKPF